MTYLDRVNSPADVKKMTAEELKGLAADIREGILKRDSLIGGHVGPNLGFVEATLALHYVFNSPEDKIVYDVSHQCYAHKMITGRKNGFLNPDDYAKISGYTNPHESEHDHFVIGHTSTSVSLASGLAKARDLKGEKYNVIAVIGDGSLSGGEALEGLDFAGSELGTNFIVVVNDNQMSIAENHGGLYNNLKQLRESNGKAETNLFKALGYDYLYVADGNDIEALIAAFRQVKDSTKPVVVHLNTLKGKGYKPAEEHKEPWHWSVPFDVKSGEKTADFGGGENYNDLTYDFLLNKIRESDAGKGGKVAVLTAGTPGVFGFTPERRAELGSHYIDVGIAEEHAVAMASALAKGGCRPVFCVYSSFIQRTYDQLSQDLAINSNPAVILVFGAGLSPMDATHLGCFDMAMAANIPNIVYLTPATKEEYLAMLEWGMTQTERPVIIRVRAKLFPTERRWRPKRRKSRGLMWLRRAKALPFWRSAIFWNRGGRRQPSLRKRVSMLRWQRYAACRNLTRRRWRNWRRRIKLRLRWKTAFWTAGSARKSRGITAQLRLKCWHTAAERNLPTASRWTRFTAKTGWNRK